MLLRTKLIAAAVAVGTTVGTGIYCLNFIGTKYNPDFKENGTAVAQSVTAMKNANSTIQDLEKNIAGLQSQISSDGTDKNGLEKKIQQDEQKLKTLQGEKSKVDSQAQQLNKDKQDIQQDEKTIAKDKGNQEKLQQDKQKLQQDKQKLENDQKQQENNVNKLNHDLNNAGGKKQGNAGDKKQGNAGDVNYYAAYKYEYTQVNTANKWAAKVDSEINQSTTSLNNNAEKLSTTITGAQQYIGKSGSTTSTKKSGSTTNAGNDTHASKAN